MYIHGKVLSTSLLFLAALHECKILSGLLFSELTVTVYILDKWSFEIQSNYVHLVLGIMYKSVRNLKLIFVPQFGLSDLDLTLAVPCVLCNYVINVWDHPLIVYIS